MMFELFNKKILRTLAVMLLIHGAFSFPAFAQSDGARQSIVEFLDLIKKMDFDHRESQEYKNLVEDAMKALDLESLSASALSNHWSDLSESERNEFVSLLNDLIAMIAFPRSQKFLGDLDIEYSDGDPVSDGVMIKSVVIHDNAALNAEIVYYLHMQQGVWTIYDIYLDDVSITEDLQYQWDRVIEDSSFAGLLEKMRVRLDQERVTISDGAGH